MVQIRTGIRKILEIPLVYKTFQEALTTDSGRKEFFERYLPVREGDSVLDVGCGPADILKYLPTNITYTGVDFEPSYIEAAQKKYGNRGKFICSDVSEIDHGQNQFDVIYLGGVLHHLEDQQVLNLLGKLKKLLKPKGYFFSNDPCFQDGQNPIAKFIISKDRGQNVRQVDGYRNLLKTVFPVVDCEVRHDLIKIPYTHILLTARLA